MTECPARNSFVRGIGPFILLAAAEIAIFFHDPQHFFIADTLVWMEYRYHSFGEFLSGFFQVDPGLWYRPLSQRTVQSLLYPVFELNPLPYRLVTFILFFVCTVAVYLLGKSVTGSRRVAWFSVLVFTPDLLHTFPTYDTAFTPELMFTIFYAGSALLYVRFLRTGQFAALAGSLTLFVGSLLSKETAAALPFTVLAIWFLLPGEKRATARSVIPFFAVLGLYTLLVFGYLHVRNLNFTDLFSARDVSSEYAFDFGAHIWRNIGMSLNWIFGIPQGIHGHWIFDRPKMFLGVQVLQACACAGAICVLFTRRRRFLLLGVAWFLTAGSPAFSLINHFLPYYMFAPLVGFALAMGSILDWVYAELAARSPHLAVCGLVLTFATWTIPHATIGRKIAAEHALHGKGARVSAITIRDIRSLYPTLPEGTDVVLFNEDAPSAPRDHAGVLLQLVYNDPSLTMHYVTEGFSLSAEDLYAGRIVVLKWIDDRIVDMTAFVHQRPDLLLPHPPSTNYNLEVPSIEFQPSRESYRLRIAKLPGSEVIILYAIDGKVMEPVRLALDDRGEANLRFPSGAAPSKFTLVAVRQAMETTWVPVGKSVHSTTAY
jgi:hypothetical protein